MSALDLRRFEALYRMPAACRVIVIHGVGDPRKLETAGRLFETLRESLEGRLPTTEIVELSWNWFLPGPQKAARPADVPRCVRFLVKLALDQIRTATKIRLSRSAAGSPVARWVPLFSCLNTLCLMMVALGLPVAVLGATVISSFTPLILAAGLSIGIGSVTILVGSAMCLALGLSPRVALRTTVLSVSYPIPLVLSGLYWWLWMPFLTIAWLGTLVSVVITLRPTLLELILARLNGPLAWVGGLLTAAVILTVIFLRRFRRAIAMIVKVWTDSVVYFADGAVRREVMEKLNDLVSETHPNVPVILVGHSLGSVIAVDWLRLTRQALPGQSPHRKVRALLTMGSPLRRLVARFFPDRYPAPAQLAQDIRKKWDGLLWRHLYQPGDWVGSSLFAEKDLGDLVQEVRLPFSWRLHTGYWGSEQVARHVIGLVKRFFERPKPLLTFEDSSDPEYPGIIRIPEWLVDDSEALRVATPDDVPAEFLEREDVFVRRWDECVGPDGILKDDWPEVSTLGKVWQMRGHLAIAALAILCFELWWSGSEPFAIGGVVLDLRSGGFPRFVASLALFALGLPVWRWWALSLRGKREDRPSSWPGSSTNASAGRVE